MHEPILVPFAGARQSGPSRRLAAIRRSLLQMLGQNFKFFDVEDLHVLFAAGF